MSGIEAKIEFNNRITPMLNRIKQKVAQLPKEGYNFFVKQTPIATGNARKNTILVKETIQANYPYASVLDKGRHMTNRGMRGSTQAPEGMSKPMFDHLEERFKQIVRSK